MPFQIKRHFPKGTVTVGWNINSEIVPKIITHDIDPTVKTTFSNFFYKVIMSGIYIDLLIYRIINLIKKFFYRFIFIKYIFNFRKKKIDFAVLDTE